MAHFPMSCWMTKHFCRSTVFRRGSVCSLMPRSLPFTPGPIRMRGHRLNVFRKDTTIMLYLYGRAYWQARGQWVTPGNVYHPIRGRGITVDVDISQLKLICYLWTLFSMLSEGIKSSDWLQVFRVRTSAAWLSRSADRDPPRLSPSSRTVF